jgi:predicted  nucleic acid-binding Zn-ribbon protein
MFDILDTGGVPVPTADAAAPGPAAETPPLGQLLRERGLLTEEQLHTGLAQQQWSGRPLGEVLIALGFVSESTIAQALATQHGGLLKTEYGFATGFDMSLRTAPTAEPPISPPSAHVLKTAPGPEPAAATVIPLHQTADSVPSAANPALEAAQAEVTVAHVRIVELEGELAAAQARSDEDGGRIAELEQAVAKARDERESAANAAYEVAQAHVNAADARVAELEQELTAVRQDESALRDELQRQAAAVDALRNELASAIPTDVGAADPRIAELEHELAIVRQGEIVLRAEYERQATELDATRNELATRHGELASTLETLRAAYARLEYLESTQPDAAHPVAPPQPPVREPGQRQATFPWQS